MIILTEKTLKRLTKCRIISRGGVGYDNIDHKYARERGYPGLRADGCRLVREGRTTPSEVVRVTRAE